MLSFLPTVNNLTYGQQNCLSLSLCHSISLCLSLFLFLSLFLSVSLSVSLFVFCRRSVHAQTHKNTFLLITLALSASLSISVSLCSFLSLKCEIRVESKVSVFITFSSEIYYFWGIGKPNKRSLAEVFLFIYLFLVCVPALCQIWGGKNTPVHSCWWCLLWMKMNVTLSVCVCVCVCVFEKMKLKQNKLEDFLSEVEWSEFIWRRVRAFLLYTT